MKKMHQWKKIEKKEGCVFLEDFAWETQVQGNK